MGRGEAATVQLMPKVAHELVHGARGLLLGAAVGDALRATADAIDAWPTEVLGGVGELNAPWGAQISDLIAAGEHAARGEPANFDLGPVPVLPVALGDATTGAGAPLLVDPVAAEAHGVVGMLLAGGSPASLSSPVLEEASKCAGTGGFSDAVRASYELGGDVAVRMPLAGAFAGARLGVTAVPSRWLTYVSGPGPRRQHHHRDLLRLADRIIGLEDRFPPDPRRAIGPVEVLDGVYAANIHRVRHFCERFPDGAVISMCPMGDALDAHPVRRSFLIEDVATRAANPRLPEVVDEVVATIAAFRAEGRPVLVHCHHGVSRTGLALRARLMATDGLDEDQATSEVEARWPWLSTANERFTRLLRMRGSLSPGDPSSS